MSGGLKKKYRSMTNKSTSKKKTTSKTKKSMGGKSKKY